MKLIKLFFDFYRKVSTHIAFLILILIHKTVLMLKSPKLEYVVLGFIFFRTIGGGILEYAQFSGGSSVTDGIVVDFKYVGSTGTATALFHKGRTAAHEVGH